MPVREQAREPTRELIRECPKDPQAVIEEILKSDDLYVILGIDRDNCDSETIRRSYIKRSRLCHPDKMRDSPDATSAFQKLSLAYETLSNPSAKRHYDLTTSLGPNVQLDDGEDTLNHVLHQIFNEFMEGDFEIIREFIYTLNRHSPGLNLGEDGIELLEAALRRLRELLLVGQKYMNIVRFEVIRIYDLQQELRGLSYFNLLGRFRISVQITRIFLAIPLVIHKEWATEIELRKYRHLDQKMRMGLFLLSECSGH
ncbi:uncharacterized protein VTP21DRAFT_7868 [Calcarisporiella thermophila]|uniref:uncharacterized protein n=1 Tax=Calcarisporiella thermophila TaxID=911321 RepID=UPI0037425E06